MGEMISFPNLYNKQLKMDIAVGKDGHVTFLSVKNIESTLNGHTVKYVTLDDPAPRCLKPEAGGG